MAEVEGVSVASSEGCQQQEPEAGKSQAAAEPSWPPEEFASEIVRIRPPPQQSDGGKAPVATLEEEVVVEVGGGREGGLQPDWLVNTTQQERGRGGTDRAPPCCLLQYLDHTLHLSTILVSGSLTFHPSIDWQPTMACRLA